MTLSHHKQPNGFALIATISVMVLLVMIALAMLSLSTIELRASQNGRAMAEAQANARMALMIAIGELQKHAGADTRVTASADIIADDNPPLLGVWKSWEGSDHEQSGTFAGRPIAPDYGSKTKNLSDDGRFISWLVSGGNERAEITAANSLVFNRPDSSTDTAPLLAEGSLGPDPGSAQVPDLYRGVHVPKMILENGGAYAWWISGENQKALVPAPSQPDPDTPARWSIAMKSHSTADPSALGMDEILDDPTLGRRIISRLSADLISSDSRPGHQFHDLSAYSVGLLTNTATGGWRKDLSLLSENWQNQPKSNLPFFQLSPGQHTSSTMPDHQNPLARSSLVYPWADYTGYKLSAPVASWANMVDYLTHYKRISIQGNGSISTDVFFVPYETRLPNYRRHQHDYLHRIRVLPVLARFHYLLSFYSKTGSGNTLTPYVLLTPVITMWNPYNVEVTYPPNVSLSGMGMSAALRFKINGVQNARYNSVLDSGNYRPPLGIRSPTLNIANAQTLMPGETRVFTPREGSLGSDTSFPMENGYRPNTGVLYSIRDSGGNVVRDVPGSTRISADAAFDANTRWGITTVNTDVVMLHEPTGGRWRTTTYRMFYRKGHVPFYRPLNDLAEVSVSQAHDNPQPFLSYVAGVRSASNSHLASKGFLTTSPIVRNLTLGTQDDAVYRSHQRGSDHPINSSFDISYFAHAPGGDSTLPNADAVNHRGYIVSGFSKADGLERCVVAELPLRPLVSLAELTNWDFRAYNSVPPFALNIIGNSDATPLLPADSVYHPNASSTTSNQYDDFYCGNHLLFDDWFFSSIAPDPLTYGTSGRDQKTVFTDFINGENPLANQAYRAIAEDMTTAESGNADDLYNDEVKAVEAWRTIASRLEVKGMFNVNSTSVTAWRALLGHARNQKVPYISENANGWDHQLTDEKDHVLSRFSIAGDKEAGGPGFSGAFPEATEFTGFRTFDDATLDALAEKVVEQIRQRGPFLSLSEFINRQLTGSATDLALGGTLQAALNELSKDPALDPFKDLKALSGVSVADPKNWVGAPNDEEYAFREAAVGHSAYGMPGWTRQADILRPLAPVLSARDDTFTIRSYGEAQDQNGKILASAWYEAVVRRTRHYIDPADDADITSLPVQQLNRDFGRRFSIVSFRWLSKDEI